jgi:formate-dependent nitrite reductase membrane component NrfD
MTDGSRVATPSPAGVPEQTPSGRRVNVSAYSGHAILKRAPWTWMIPAYFFLGGTAGMAASIAGFARVSGNRRLARPALLVSAIAFVPCAPLLILDLGRPERFYNMLRVFRPTSPMNIGTWILTAFGGALAGAVGSEVTGLARKPAAFLTAVAAALGPALSTYTAVLLANTSTPAWHEARRELPFVFAAGAAASAGAALCLATPFEAAVPARRLAIAGALAELLGARVMETRLGDAGAGYRTGAGHGLASTAEVLGLAGAGVLAIAGRRRAILSVGAVLVLAGAAAERFAIWKAGDESADRT